MRTRVVKAGTGKYSDYKTYGKCDQCSKGATHVVGNYKVGEPHRFCHGHYSHHCKVIKAMKANIRIGMDKIRADMKRDMPEFYDYFVNKK